MGKVTSCPDAEYRVTKYPRNVIEPGWGNAMSEPEVFTITNAQSGTTDNQRASRMQYVIMMTIRTICFIAAVFTSGALRWVMVAGAVALPYFAVVIANGGRSRQSGTNPAPFTPHTHNSLEAHSTE